MNFLKIDKIFSIVDNCIENKKPFSHIRFGDGGLKFIDSIINEKRILLSKICKKEGIPKSKVLDILDLWGYYARMADCIDTPEVYYNSTFWPRIKKEGKPISKETNDLMKSWKYLYSQAEIDNDTFCNPESNCLFILNRDGKVNLFDIMKNRKICMIATNPKIKDILSDYDIDIIEIVGQWKNQYENSFENVINFLSHNSNIYDLFLISAGELGRIYTGYIKENGGRALDLGFVAEYWVNGYLHPRFHPYIVPNDNNKLELKLTSKGKIYEQCI